MSLGAVVPDGSTFTPLGLPPAAISYAKPCAHCGLRSAPMTAERLKEYPAFLTEKERRAIVLLCQGFQNKEIADKMGTSEQTIKNTFRATFQKIGCSDRTGLLIRMMRFKYEGV